MLYNNALWVAMSTPPYIIIACARPPRDESYTAFLSVAITATSQYILFFHFSANLVQSHILAAG